MHCPLRASGARLRVAAVLQTSHCELDYPKGTSDRQRTVVACRPMPIWNGSRRGSRSPTASSTATRAARFLSITRVATSPSSTGARRAGAAAARRGHLGQLPGQGLEPSRGGSTVRVHLPGAGRLDPDGVPGPAAPVCDTQRPVKRPARRQRRNRWRPPPGRSCRAASTRRCLRGLGPPGLALGELRRPLRPHRHIAGQGSARTALGELFLDEEPWRRLLAFLNKFWPAVATRS